VSSGPANYPGKGVSLLAFASARADGGCGANRHPLRHIDAGSLIAFPNGIGSCHARRLKTIAKSKSKSNRAKHAATSV
jgi:hypothetical protein